MSTLNTIISLKIEKPFLYDFHLPPIPMCTRLSTSFAGKVVFAWHTEEVNLQTISMIYA